MISALNPTAIVRVVSLTTFLLTAVLCYLTEPELAGAVWALKSVVIAIPNAVVFALTLRPVFRWAHKASFARYWMFPWLDGSWEGEIHSNWPKVDTVRRAALGQIPAYDPAVDPLPADAPEGRIHVTAEIVSGLFEMRITIRSTPERWSETIFVKPSWCRPNPPLLHYLYIQRDKGKILPTDTRTHLGAGCLEYDAFGDELTGEYWTSRAADRALNTAGAITLRRGVPPNVGDPPDR